MSTDAKPEAAQGAPNLPPGARWNQKVRGWSLGEWDDAQRPSGRHQVYNRDGKLVSTLSFVAGELEGPFEDLHPSGELARSGSFKAGKLHGDCIRYASAAPTPHALRACCVPKNAWSMKSRFAEGRCLFEHFYDQQEQRLLDDGTLFPPLPKAVPESAHFDSKTRRWWLVSFNARGQREGVSSSWLEDGRPHERCEYRADRRHGVWEKFTDGTLTARYEFREGQLHGAAFERTSAYVDPRISQRRGQYDAGRPCGVWRFEDEHCACVTQVELGQPPAEGEIEQWMKRALAESSELRDAAQVANLEGYAPRTRSLAELTACGRSLLLSPSAAQQALVRARGVLARLAPEQTQSATEASIRKLRNEHPESAPRIAALLDALCLGAEPLSTLRELAAALAMEPELALQLASVAVCLAPERMDVLGSRAIIAIELGLLSLVERDLAVLEAGAPEAAQSVRFAADVKLAPFRFAPSSVALDEALSDELPSEVAQPLDSVRVAIGKLALRLLETRRELEKRVSPFQSLELHAALWPPELSALAEGARLEDYSFEQGEAGEVDTIQVAEKLTLAELQTSELLSRARLDWIGLCWLCWGVGLGEVAMPVAVRPQPLFARAMCTAYTRVWLARDRRQTLGLMAKKQGLPGFQWHGAALDALAPRWVRAVCDEYLEMRAALFFLGDPSCRSFFQDDLRA